MSGGPLPGWGDWLAVCGFKREGEIWGGRAVAGGGRSDLLADRLEAAIAAERPAGLISFGVCGALCADLAVADVIVGRSVAVPDGEAWTCDPDAARRLAERTGGRSGEVAALDHVVTAPAEKKALGRRFATVDMESHVAARVAAAHSLPLAVLRVVSDDAGHTMPPAAVASMRPDGGIDGPAILWSLLRRPGQLPALIRLGRDSGKAFAALSRARRALR